MRHGITRFLGFLCLAILVIAGGRSHDASAAWPPSPGADMKDKSNWPNDFDARWNYISYFPDDVGVLEPQDVKLGAAGMSIDRAWTLTIGRADSIIAVIDSGIHWDHPDLANKAYLNMRELDGAHRPQTAGGAPCGGVGPLAGYDCNGDGVFSVADYRDDPRIAPAQAGQECFQEHDKSKPKMGRILGDVNRNCILDPGDLILLFSDGIDDDGNGYKDDISGWDFYKNDNDPYDDTRYGHGTGQAVGSAGEVNNGVGEASVCPNCRFMPMRVGDSFIVDVNDFAKAVVYATDNNAKVIQEALGTVNQTAFSKAAIDYAYKKGLIVIASMGDENSRHHNMPATANHVLSVHSIRYDGDRTKGSTTFVAFDTCSNYGGHLSMSVSGKACSSEATNRASGISGLLFSMAAQEGLNLSAEEAIQLFKMTADDIDVPESRSDPNLAKSYFSQPGYDQRFGYGRANAMKIVEAIRDRRIPPEVDVVSPEWFAPIHADRTPGAIAVMGSVAAKRAQTYDLKVQWAPGVQPAESEYKDLIAPLRNVPGTTVTGGTTPLAQLDPKEVDTTHTPDFDSPRNENKRTISIRVQAIAHYAGYDVPGEARRVISITNDKNGGHDTDLLPGFPLHLGSSIEAGTKMFDIDGDGVRDLIVPDSGGFVHAYKITADGPKELPGFPYATNIIDGLNPALTDPAVPNYRTAPAYAAGANGGIDPTIARETLLQSPGIGDINGDGKADLVFTTAPGTVHAIGLDGKDLPGWPKRLPLVPSCSLDPTVANPTRCMARDAVYARGSYSAGVLVDMNKDGKLDVVISAFDGKIYVFNGDGTDLPGFPVDLVSPKSKKPARSMATPTVGDMNGDGIPEIAAGTNQLIGGGESAGPVFLVDGRGNAAPGGPYLPNWPITMTSIKLFPLVAEGVVASQAMADFDGDGKPDVLIQGNVSRPLVAKADPGVQNGFEDPPNRLPNTVDQEGNPQQGIDATSIFGELSKAYSPDVMFPLFSTPSIGDLDMDGTPDIISTGGSLTFAGALSGGGKKPSGPQQQLVAMWNGKTGRMMPGSPFVIEDYTFLMNSAVADVSGDGYPEVITGNGAYFVHAVDGCGREAEGWPKFTNGWLVSPPSVGDVDGNADQGLEVASATRNGWLFVWRTKGSKTGVVQWESFHHDNQNTGNFATKIDQGGTTTAPQGVLSCAVPEPPPGEKFFFAGGCECNTSTTSRNTPAYGGLAALGGLALLVFRRRRSS